MLDRDALRSYLDELADVLAARQIRAEMFVVGGAAMALAYNTRRATRDIDAVFEPKGAVYQAAAEVAERHPDALDSDWLNDAVKGLLPGRDPHASVVFEHEGLRVLVASPGYLLAMKVAAARVERDVDDIVALIELCDFTSVEEALNHVESVYPHAKLEPRSQFLLEEIFAQR